MLTCREKFSVDVSEEVKISVADTAIVLAKKDLNSEAIHKNDNPNVEYQLFMGLVLFLEEIANYEDLERLMNIENTSKDSRRQYIHTNIKRLKDRLLENNSPFEIITRRGVGYKLHFKNY